MERFIYIAPQLTHVLTDRAHYTTAQAHTHGLWPVAIQLLCHLMISTPIIYVNTWITTHIGPTDPRGIKELA